MRISDWSSDVCSSDLEQFVALAPADRALQRGQILGEALEHLEHRLAIGEEHVAPHRRVRRGDAGEVAETAGRIFDDLALGRSEEHTSELQSLMRISYAVFCLNKKIQQKINISIKQTSQHILAHH